MPGIIISSGIPANTPTNVQAAVIRARRKWTDSWITQPDWIFHSATEHTGNQDMGRMVFSVPYGRVITHTAAPGSDYRTVLPANLVGWWVQLLVLGDQNQLELVWQGRIMNDSGELGGRDVPGPTGASVETGMQTFTAYSGLDILQRIKVSESWWLIPDQLTPTDPDHEVRVQKLHPMNIRDRRGFVVGNASTLQYDNGVQDPIYLHGPEGELWTREDYLRYIMRYFLQRHLKPEPQWTLAGDGIRFLADIKDSLDFGSVATVDSIIRKLIDPRFGIDFAIQPTLDGYEINVFALSGDDVGFGPYAMPKNTNTAVVHVDRDIGLEKNLIVRSKDHHYHRINVVSQPMVVCFSLWAANSAVTTGTLPPTEQRETLEAKWTTTLEDDYKAGKPGATEASLHDIARAADRYASVYQQFGAKKDWDFHKAQVLPDMEAETGEIIGLIGNPFFGDGMQNFVRRTLAFLPMKEGFDYTKDPPVDANPPEFTPELARPVAFVYYEDPDTGAKHYVRCEDLGIVVHVSTNDWGVVLSSKPGHKLALNHFSGAEETLVEPIADWKTLVVTLAIELDWRLTLRYVDDTGDDDGSVETIEVEDAEFWYLAPETAVHVDEDGKLGLSPKTTKTQPSGSGGQQGTPYNIGTILRNDADRLAQVMAGTLARYRSERARAVLTFRGYRPFTNLLGAILTAVTDGGQTSPVGAVITTVEFTATKSGEAFTTIRTGHAGG